ncbi:MAG TPA: sigma 54-interacting transcriptional regulator, partial [bacterium]|nr:sigma 54-interacting transcriptional regulator [bacterium]
KYLETNGAVALAPARPRSLPKSFVGRSEILAEAKSFLTGLKLGAKEKALLLVGEKGLGAEALLTELKYEAELQDLEVQTSAEEKGEGLAILSAEEFRNLPAKPRFSSLATALEPEAAAAAAKQLSAWQPRILKLRPLNLGETEQYLRDTTRNAELPRAFVEGLQKFSGGYPDTMRAALESLLQDPLIVDASGKWHLAAYRESVPDFFGLASTETDWNRLLDQEKSPERRWQLELLQAEAMAKENQLDPAREILGRLESDLPSLFSRAERLEQKPRVWELRGWIFAKQGRYAEAREDFAAALSLLKETAEPSRSLSLRLRNFLAFLDLQEGRTEAAIREFESTRAEARTLPSAEARLVTNNELANAYLAAGRLSEGIAQLKTDLDFFANHPDAFFRMKVAYNLGEALAKAKDYPGATEAYRRVAETARLERHWDYLIRAYNGLGNIASLVDKRPESLDYYQRSLALAEYRRDFLCAATVAQNRGVILSELGRLEEADRDIELSKRLVAKVHPSSHTRYLMARATLELGEICRKRKDFATARAYFAEARNRSEEDIHLKSFRFYPLASMAALALDQGDLEGFRRLAPDLIHLSEGEAEKKALQELLGRAPVDPRAGREEKPSSRVKFDTEASDSALSNILKINRALLTERDPRLLFRKILEHAAELCGAETALLLLEDEREGLTVRETFNTELDPGQIEISQQIARQVLESGNPVVTPDAQHDRGFSQFQSVVALHLRSIACVPIRAGLRSVGVLYLTHRFQTDLFNPRILRLLEAFGDQAGLALQNVENLKRLEEMNAKLQGQLEAAEEEIDRLKVDLRGQLKNPYPRILGKSRAIVEILGLLDRVSDTNLSILILGETGSGKELVARSIHEHSRRRQGPFIAVNCGAIPENLMESELFGYKAGAFTGAVRDKKGLLEEAQGGTLFLDEIAELPLNTQAKLLRALQEKEIVRLGETRPLAVDIRVISATHRRLEEWIADGKFREDLYYRVAQMVLQLPALRERRE